MFFDIYQMPLASFHATKGEGSTHDIPFGDGEAAFGQA